MKLNRRDLSGLALALATQASTSWAQTAAKKAAPSVSTEPQPKPEEGKEYIALDKRVPTETADGKIEVIEFFWYNCPHCNAFEPAFEAWVKTLPKDVALKRVPVRFNDSFEAQQRAYYVFESLNLIDAMHGKLFNAIHVQGQKLNTLDALAPWANANGLPEQKFRDTFNSFGVATKAKRAFQLQEAFKVEGVPALGIAGRFYTDGGKAGSMKRALEVTDYLIGEVRKGR